MKKSVSLALVLLLALSLTGCGGGETVTTPPPSGAFAFPVGDYSVEMNADMAQVLEKLGQPAAYFEAASCAFEGLDKTYTYAGFAITTRPDGDKDYVNDILLTDSTVATAEGVRIGDPASAVTAAYGEQAVDGGVLLYDRGGVTLLFIFEGDKVLSIEYYPAVD